MPQHEGTDRIQQTGFSTPYPPPWKMIDGGMQFKSHELNLKSRLAAKLKWGEQVRAEGSR
ncbi:unnamed protein product [Sphenostylis stenocarpa]|uniref:Uncharacterized protein n=1 Tax=Sphenostylis stenocarpa TaxID=92480 RepID=A0AA86S7A4_9FABA|nr:unnamed protein product [Sphenostylis stenocarpa]